MRRRGMLVLLCWLLAGSAAAAGESCRDTRMPDGQVVRMCKAPDGRWAAAQDVAAPAAAMPPRAEITYTGPYLVNVSKPGPAIARMTWNDLRRAVSGDRTRRNEGIMTIIARFDGAAVHATISGTGGVSPSSLSGLVRDGVCHLTDDKTGIMYDGTCDTRRFRTKVAGEQDRNTVRGEIDASATQVVDIDQRDRQVAAAAAAAPRPLAAANATPARATSTGVPDMDAHPNVHALKGLHRLTVQFEDVDDTAALLVVNADGTYRAALSAEWTMQNQGGEGMGDITPLLKPGRNLLIFFLHNKAFMFGAGKWSFKARIMGDGQAIWQAGAAAAGGGVGIQFWKAIDLIRRPNGTVDVFAPTAATNAGLKPIITTMNARLLRSAGTEQSVMASLAQGFMSAASGSGGGGDRGSACDAGCQYQEHVVAESGERERAQAMEHEHDDQHP